MIRSATPSDAKEIQQLLAQLGYPDFSEQQVGEKIKLHQQSGYQILVSENEGKVTGFIALHWFELMHWQGQMGRITAFCINENHRATGIGTRLLKAAEEFLLARGCVKFEVTSNIRRTRTHGFYLKNGYVEDSRRFVKYIH